MPEPRPQVIEALVDAGSEAMMAKAEALDGTPGEAISAQFTMLHRAVKALLKHSKGTDRQLNRGQIIDGLMTIFKTAEDAGSIH